MHEKGFIAQEFATVYPDSVIETEFINEEDKQYFDENEKPFAIGFNAEFYADLVSAIQELNAKVAALEAQLGAK